MVAGAVASEFGVGVGIVALGAVSLSATVSGAVVTESKVGGRTGQSVGLGLEIGGAVASMFGVGLGAQLAAKGGQAALAALQTGKTAMSGIRVASAATAAVAGTAKAATAEYERIAAAATADGTGASHIGERASAWSRAAVDSAKALNDSNARARAILARALTERLDSEREGLAGMRA